MIAAVIGHIIDTYKLGPDHAVVVKTVSDVAYEIITVTPVLTDEKIVLHVHHVVREDAEILFGYQTFMERHVAIAVSTTDGIGPRGAARIVRKCGVDAVARAVRSKKIEELKDILKGSGVGQKVLENLVRNPAMTDGIAAVDVGTVNSIDTLGRARAALAKLGVTGGTIDNLLAETIKAVPEIAVEQLVKQVLDLVRGLKGTR